MALSKRMAVTLPAGPDIRQTIERLRWAEDNGYPDAWFSDSGAPDTLTQAAAVAQHTQSIRIGVAVTPVYTRTPAVIAASVNAASHRALPLYTTTCSTGLIVSPRRHLRSR